jgi:HTH-type transcriptional regulator / antitoxin HipB
MLLRTPADLGSAIRERRRQLNLDQGDLAEEVGVSRKWVVDVEKGKPRAEIGLILRTLDVLGLRLSLEASPTVSGPDHAPVVDIDEVLNRTREKAR